MKKEGLKENILKLRMDGLKYNEIKDILKCSKSTISYHCNKCDLGDNYLDYKDFNLDKQTIDIVIEMRKYGALYVDIKKETGLSLDKIKVICRKNKMTDSNIICLAESLKKEMQEYYNECGVINKVVEKFGFNRNTVSKYIITKSDFKMSDEDRKKIRKKSISKNVTNYRKRKKKELVEYKGGCCEICGYKKSIRSLSFHHKIPKEKSFGISAKTYSFERLKKEVDKCILVCSNCHSEIHDEIEKYGYSNLVNDLKKKK